ncbi:MAG: ABC transporter ATP-binding protein [Verrucomicrobia bacterium]|nr:ABC transporter ATP-binding protein [Verrucomicrobiota bacterium]
MATSPIVELLDVTKRFGDGPVVIDRLNLAVPPGEFVTLLGPSGCGKSTLLRLIAGLSPATAGTLRIEGRTPEAAGAGLGFVFQEATLLPWLTVAHNVELPLRLRGVPAAERAATRRQVLGLVGLGDRGGAYPRQLSGGQKMRVSIARALALAPKIMLLDEPFGALDEMTRERLNEELLAIRREQGWTAFFVTHSVAEAVFLSDRIVVLAPHPGRIHAVVSVDLPGPRTAATRLTPSYLDLVTRTSQVLRGVAPASGHA